jgi:hypothetical protein
MKRINNNNAERGNILFYILIAVALLAALIFAVGQSGRGSAQHVSEEKAKLVAGEITDYANSVSNAFAQLRLRGCKLEQVSFENSIIAGYANPDAPVDKTCHVFELAGGGITFKNPPAEAGTGAIQLITGELEVTEVGATNGDDNSVDLLFVSGPLSEAVCFQLNERLDVPNPSDAPPPGEAEFNSLQKYTGEMTQEAELGNDPASAAFRGRSAACIQDTNDNLYYFYKVLAAR